MKNTKQTNCTDAHCTSHGSLSTRGRTFVGVVIADKMQKTVNVEWGRRKKVPKYERYLKLRSRVKAHNPSCIHAKKGDIVEIKECRPLSKTKNFVIIKKIGEDELFIEKERLLTEGKHIRKEETSETKTEENSKESKSETTNNVESKTEGAKE